MNPITLPRTPRTPRLPLLARALARGASTALGALLRPPGRRRLAAVGGAAAATLLVTSSLLPPQPAAAAPAAYAEVHNMKVQFDWVKFSQVNDGCCPDHTLEVY